MSQEQILLVTRQTLINDFGGLDDLPHELANSIANVYYRYWALADAPDRQVTSLEDSIANMNELARIQGEFEWVKQVVPALRELKAGHPNVFEDASDLFLSQLKYRIDDAAYKSPIRLTFERFLNRHKVNEIPGLIDALQIH